MAFSRFASRTLGSNLLLKSVAPAPSFFVPPPSFARAPFSLAPVGARISLAAAPTTIFQQKRFFAKEASASAGQNVSFTAGDVATILKKGEFAKFRQVLEKDGRDKIDVPEYLRLAKENGINEKDARQLAQALTDAGIVIYLPNSTDPILANLVHLKPQKVTQAIYQAMDYHGVAVTKRMGELQALRAEFEKLKNTKEEIDDKAHAAANRLIWLGGVYLIAQAGILARFTWWEFSWDIVEPITYFVTFTGGLIGYLYFATTKNEYTYENLRDRLARTRREKWYKKANFDPAQFEALRKTIQELEQDLKPYLPPTPSLTSPSFSTTPSSAPTVPTSPSLPTSTSPPTLPPKPTSNSA